MNVVTLFVCVTCTVLFPSVHCKCTSNDRCKCHTLKSVGILANCSSLNLETWPMFYNLDIAWIDMSNNSLIDSPVKGTLPDRLQWMDISHNRITTFLKGTFSGLIHLKVLNISNNHFMINHTVFYENVFKDLKALEYLDMQNNYYQQSGTPRSYPDKAVKHLISLKSLKMDGIPGYYLGSGFLKNRQLETLNLSGATGFCGIFHLSEDFFTNVPSIKFLDLSYCSLNWTTKDCLRNLPNLTHLDISHNYQLTMCGLKNLTQGLHFTSIKVLKANSIYCPLGRGTYVAMNFLSALLNIQLEELYLDDNRIDYMHPAISIIIPSSLKKLSLVGNRLTAGIYMYRELSYVVGLESMDISFQHRHAKTPPLEEQFLCDDYNISLECECQNREPHLYKQPIQTKTFTKQFMGQKITSCTDLTDLSIPRNLKSLKFEFSHIGSTIGGMSLGYYHKIENFSIRGNSFTDWQGPLCNVSTIKFMDLSENLCSNISSYFFDNFSGLQSLLLESNYLVYPLSQDTDGFIFKGLGNLVRLSLYNNRIDVLPRLIFRGLPSLKTLNLSTNGLSDITFNMNYFNLSTLDLSNNYIRYFSDRTMQELDNQCEISINLINNSLVCTCESLPFLKWFRGLYMKNNRIQFIKRQLYMCKTSDDTKVKLSSVLEELSNLEKICRKTSSYLVILLAFGIISILFAIAGFLIKRHKWKIQYFLYLAKRELMKRKYEPLRNTEEYKYDVFISYADEDRPFVLDQVFPRLEEKFSVCIHDKDFIPGSDIADNIIGAIRNSRKTVLIISKHFIKSDWCMYEFNMALYEEKFARRIPLLIFIFRGDIPIERLPLKIAEARDSTVFADFPRDAEDEPIFWNMLERAMLSETDI